MKVRIGKEKVNISSGVTSGTTHFIDSNRIEIEFQSRSLPVGNERGFFAKVKGLAILQLHSAHQTNLKENKSF